MIDARPRVSDAIEGLIRTHQFWSTPRLAEKMEAAGLQIIAADVKAEMAYLREQLPSAAPVWVAPHICPLIAAGGASYPLDIPLDPAAVPFSSAWVWFADPLPVPGRDGVRALLIRTCRARAIIDPGAIVTPGARDGFRNSTPPEVTPVGDPSAADGLWVHIFLDMPEQRPLPWMSGMVAIEYARPGAWLRYVRALNKGDGNWNLPREQLDAYSVQGEAVIGHTLALLAFLRQRVLVQSREPIQNNGVTKRLRRDGYKGDMAIRVITLRAADPTGDGHDARKGYDHRFAVRGHWRQQPYGPRKSLRRARWVDSYIKGDPSLPLATPQWTAYKVAR